MAKRLFITLIILAAAFTGLQHILTKAPVISDDATIRKAAIEKKAQADEAVAQRKQRVKGMLRMDAPDKFYEYLYGIRYREGGPAYPFNYRVSELLKAYNVSSIAEWQQRKSTLQKSSGLATWVERGPGNVSGRTRGLVVDADDPTAGTFYAGSVGGGVWKTTDAGQSWTLMTPDLGNFATSAIVQAPSNPDVMYVGTGEGFGNVDQVDGSGIWKTTDRGASWQLLQSTSNLDFQNVTRLAIDPDNENIILASTAAGFNHNSSTASSSGIWKSTDGGANWSKEYSNSSRIEHLIADPTDFSRQYATVKGTGVARSEDGGESWSLVSAPFSGVGRMEIAVAPTDPSRLYISADGGASGTGATLYISRDYGQTWAAASEKTGSAYNWLGGQGWYDNTINVHPFDEDIVFVGGINLWRIDVENDDKIETTVVTDGYGQFGGSSKGVHVDQHNIVMVVTDSASQSYRMIVCNDGGVSYSDNGGSTFSHTENGYNTSQFYGVDKKNGASEYIGGMQDNNTYQSPAGVDADAGSNWIVRKGGDGFQTVWHYTNPDLILASSQFNGISKSSDGGQSFSSATIGLETGSGNAPFYTKIAGSQQDPDVVFAAGASGIYRSADFGSSWELVASPAGWVGTSSFTHIEISTANPQTIWAGRNFNSNDRLYLSTDGGYTFSTVSGYNENPLGRISGIATHSTDEQTAYALFSYAQGPKILRTTNWGGSWEDISGFGSGSSSNNGFPDVAVYSLVDIPDTDILWAGTDIGIFESSDDGASWHPLAGNLPNVSVFELKIVNDQVVAATHGRGIWTISLGQLSGYEPPKVALSPRFNSAQYNPLPGFEINASLRGNYDSTRVYANDVWIYSLGASAEGDTTFVAPFDGQESQTVTLKLVSYEDDRPLRSEERDAEFYILAAPRDTYTNDFSDGGDEDFFGEGFQRKLVNKFNRDWAIHSDHPYENDRGITYTLSSPIKVSADNAFMRYRDIALIEPGESGSQFGDEDFWDYVVVEATKNAADWIPLADGYDARYDQAWLDAYTNDQDGEFDLYVDHELNLLDHFSAGDTILIRFRLFADPFVNGWGWAIDNIEIQGTLTTLEKSFVKGPARFNLMPNYPNPFNPTTRIAFSLAENAPVNLTIYDIRGAIVRRLLDARKYSAGVRHEVVWDGRDHLGREVASGTYFYRIEAQGYRAVRKMILLR